MNDITASPPLPPPPEPRKSAWPLVWTALAWVVIVGLVSWQFLARHLAEESPRQEARDERLNEVVMRGQARYLVGVREYVEVPGLYEQARAFNTGPVGQRLRFVVLAGELRGPSEALQELHKLERLAKQRGVKFTPEQAALRDILDRLYRDYEALRFDAPSLSPKEREQLRQGLGWFGELALAPGGKLAPWEIVLPAAGAPAAVALRGDPAPDPVAREQALAPARRTFVAFISGLGGACLFGFAGLAGLIVFLVLAFRGKLQGGIRCGASPGGVYAETFALWLVLFMGMGFVGLLLPPEAPRLLLSGAGALLSLVALGWPVLRGVPWRQVREDVGLTAGRRPALEPLYGVTCYGISLPLLAVGLLLVYLLMLLLRGAGGGGQDSFAPPSGPAHPIVEDVARGDALARLEVLFLACVVAPVVEETMFRGVLYRHLREGTCRLGGAGSFLISAVVVSFLFAVIHPQGLIGVPALMALACGFAIAREWRGSLIAAMTGHALNNGLVMLFTMVALGD